MLQFITHFANVLHYMNDFLFVDSAEPQQCTALAAALVALCAELGVPLPTEKVKEPSTHLTFLGVQID